MVIAAVVVVVVIVVGAGLYFGLAMGGGSNTNTSTGSSNTSTATTPPSGSLSSAVNSFIQAFNNRDINTIKTFYTDSSKINWWGSTGGLGGNYSGADGAGIVYGTSVGHSNPLTANATTPVVTSTGADTSTVAYTLTIRGHSAVVGNFNSTADVTQYWAYSAGIWTIQKDNWNYLNFVSSNPSQGATVFPQWGLSLNGQPPSLSGEHVFEWNVAPILAAAVYGTIVVLGVILLMVRVRKPKK